MRKARLHWHFLRRDSYLRFPLNGNLLEALDEGRAEIGPWVLIERGCWFALYPETATMAIGEGTILNLGCMVAAAERIEIGAPLHVRQPLLRDRRRPPLRRPRPADHLAGLQPRGPGEDRRQLLVRRQLRGDRRSDDRRAHGGRRELGRDAGSAGGRGRRRRAGEGDQGDRVQDSAVTLFAVRRPAIGDGDRRTARKLSSEPAPSRCAPAACRRSRAARTAARCRSGAGRP